MYSVNKNKHSKHGHVVSIIRDDVGDCLTPYQAFLKAKKIKRIWSEEENIKVKCLIDSKVMTITQVEAWSYEEYKILPKCAGCAQILLGKVYTNKFCDNQLFCSQTCSSKEENYQIEKLNEDESDSF